MTTRTASAPASAQSVPRGPGPRAWATMTRTEARLVVRDTAGLLIPIGVPVLFMVMSAMGSGDQRHAGLGGLTVLEAISVPGTLVMILALFGTVNVPSFLASHRQYGVLRRLSATPARPIMLLAAQVAVNAALGAIGIALALTVAVMGFGAGAPRNPAGAVLTIVLAACALYGAGLIVASIAPTANAALAIGLVAFFAMMSTGGGMLPAENLPTVVARIGEFQPFGAAMHALRESWMGGTPSLLHLGVLVATTLVSVGVASRVFRWD